TPNHHKSDLRWKMRIVRGYDPRDFVVYAFGGAGPLHGAAFGRELGVQEIMFPLGNIASAFSALGLAVSDVTAVTQTSDLALAPFDSARVNQLFERLEQDAAASFSNGTPPQEIAVERIL